mmetsp:Transcript_27060/g.46319  ORF Transcript_27060/g.46319 Transcript_27060/m.46319 type:complete len:248 (+) Transcript_27060:2254-2997(+)
MQEGLPEGVRDRDVVQRQPDLPDLSPPVPRAGRCHLPVQGPHDHEQVGRTALEATGEKVPVPPQRRSLLLRRGRQVPVQVRLQGAGPRGDGRSRARRRLQRGGAVPGHALHRRRGGLLADLRLRHVRSRARRQAPARAPAGHAALHMGGGLRGGGGAGRSAGDDTHLLARVRQSAPRSARACTRCARGGPVERQVPRLSRALHVRRQEGLAPVKAVCGQDYRACVQRPPGRRRVVLPANAPPPRARV